jgi:aerobic-type carbon monoxide dehydrogenase small subunit (CoxS/CutS family)
VGEKLSIVAENAGIPITYKCKKGECGTCQVMIDGKWVKACQHTIAMPENPSAILQINVTSKKEERKKPAKFFSPASFVEGVINNGLGVVGFVKEAMSVDDEFEQRMAREKALNAKLASSKQKK